MAKKVEEERKISPALIVPIALAGLLGLGVIIYAATRVKAPPGLVYKCPYCGDIFLTQELLDAHIYWWHPEEELVEPEPEPAPPIEEPVTLSNLVVPTGPVPIGKLIPIYFDATNPNDIQVVVTITVSGDFSRTITKVLDPNSITTISFGVTLEAAGTYLIRVDGLEAYITSEILEVELSNLRAAPEIVTIGQKVTIRVDVSNPNWETGVTYLVQLTGAIQAEQEVTLAPHETETVTFIETVTWQAWGTIYCDGLSVRVKGEVYVPPGEEPPPPYTDELKREISLKYKEFLEQLVLEATDGAGGYMSAAWWSMLTMQERHDLTVEAEDMARQWFFDKYGYWWPF